MPDFSVIITGASRGLGRAAAQILARAGVAVTLNARSAPALVQLQREIRADGGRAVILPGDISDPDVARRVIASAVSAFGGLDALINNAAALKPVARIADSDPTLWLRHLQVNVWAPFLLTQAALPHLRRAPHGRVITISSGASVRAVPGWSAYCTSKAAINMFTAVLAAEEPGITALALRPAITMAVIMGASSRETEMATISTIKILAPNFCNCAAPW